MEVLLETDPGLIQNVARVTGYLSRLRLKSSPYFFCRSIQIMIFGQVLFYFLASMHDGRMVATSEVRTDVLERFVGQLPYQVHG